MYDQYVLRGCDFSQKTSTQVTELRRVGCIWTNSENQNSRSAQILRRSEIDLYDGCQGFCRGQPSRWLTARVSKQNNMLLLQRWSLMEYSQSCRKSGGLRQYPKSRENSQLHDRPCPSRSERVVTSMVVTQYRTVRSSRERTNCSRTCQSFEPASSSSSKLEVCEPQQTSHPPAIQ